MAKPQGFDLAEVWQAILPYCDGFLSVMALWETHGLGSRMLD